MPRVLIDAELRRIHQAERNGVAMYELAKMYHLTQAALKKQLEAWRQARRLTGVGRITMHQLGKAAERVVPLAVRREMDRNWLFAK